jgi:HTH-type transcriptional regulator/antitoxin HipB
LALFGVLEIDRVLGVRPSEHQPARSGAGRFDRDGEALEVGRGASAIQIQPSQFVRLLVVFLVGRSTMPAKPSGLSRLATNRWASCDSKNLDSSWVNENSAAMNYPVDTSSQLASVLRSMRRAKKLTQADVGKKMGVSLKRISGIELNPGVTTFDQITRLVASLGGRLVVTVENEPQVQQQKPAKPRAAW